MQIIPDRPVKNAVNYIRGAFDRSALLLCKERKILTFIYISLSPPISSSACITDS